MHRAVAGWLFEGLWKKCSGLGRREMKEDLLRDYYKDQKETRNKDGGNRRERVNLRDFWDDRICKIY